MFTQESAILLHMKKAIGSQLVNRRLVPYGNDET